MKIDIEIIAILLAPGFVAWFVYPLWPARVIFVDEKIIKKHRWKSQHILLADLTQIKFHYHAVVGFSCAWEFISRSGESFVVEAMRIDRKFLSTLERHLPNFSVEKFYKEFQDGDVEDTIDVWMATSA